MSLKGAFCVNDCLRKLRGSICFPAYPQGCVHIYHHRYFPARPAIGYTLSDLPDKPWSRVSSLPPHYVSSFPSTRRVQHSRLIVDFHRMLLTQCSRGFCYKPFGSLIIPTKKTPGTGFRQYQPSAKNQHCSTIISWINITISNMGMRCV